MLCYIERLKFSAETTGKKRMDDDDKKPPVKKNTPENSPSNPDPNFKKTQPRQEPRFEDIIGRVRRGSYNSGWDPSQYPLIKHLTQTSASAAVIYAGLKQSDAPLKDIKALVELHAEAGTLTAQEAEQALAAGKPPEGEQQTIAGETKRIKDKLLELKPELADEIRNLGGKRI